MNDFSPSCGQSPRRFNWLQRGPLLVAGLALAAIGTTAQAQTVPGYAFSQNLAGYTPITGGTLVATAAANADDLDANVYQNLPIGFTFRFAGTNYTTFSLSTNGFITLGAVPPNTFEPPISSTTSYDAALAPFGADLVGNINSGFGSAGQLRYETIGSSPNRTLVVQFSNFQPAGTTTATLLNFQVRLDEAGNVVRFAYGSFQVGAGLNTQAEVGLRGAYTGAATTFNNRTTTTDWTQTTPGPSSGATMRLTPTVKPPLGLEYVFTPPNSCPSPQQLSVSTITGTSARLTFTAASPAPAGGYTVTVSSGAGSSSQAVSGSPYVLTGLSAGTTYTAALVSNCAGGTTSVAATVTFTTTAACTVPTAVAVSNSTTTTAQVDFTAGNGNTSFTATATPAAGGNGPVTASGTVLSLTLTGLASGIRYNVTVTGTCSDGTALTSAPAVSFVTAAANDDPATAQLLTIGSTCAPTNGANVGATTTPANGYANPGSCGAAANPKDVWYVFTTPASGATSAGVRVAVSGTAAGTVRVFSSANGAAGPFTQVACSAGTTNNTQAPAFDAPGLTPGTTYYISVAGYGSNDGQNTFTICLTPPNSCLAPTGVAASSVTPTSASISFAAATGAATYTVTYTPAGGPALTASNPTSPIALSGLTASTTYSVIVTSNCGGGQGATSSPAISFTTPAPPCAAPTSVAANSVTAAGASISFGAGTSAASYTVTYTPQGSTALTMNGTASPIALSSLAASTTYSVTVTSNCGGGQTATSSPAINFTTSAAPCVAPANVAVGSITQTSASISFATGTGATNYTVTYTPGGGTAQTVSGSTSPITLSGLTAATTYSVTVTSNCGGGQTATSAPAVSFTTNNTPCVAPTNVAAGSTTPTSASISFAAGTGAASYTVTYTPQGGTAQTASGNTSPVVLNGLTASTTYSATVTSNCGSGQTATSSPALSFTTAAAPLTDLTVNSAQNVQGNYNNVTITGGGTATLTGALTVAGTLNVAGALITNCQPVSGPGSFVLQASGRLEICDPAGISATGTSGAVQLTSTRTFAPEANYVYNGSTSQTTGSGLPAQVRRLEVANSRFLTLSQPLNIGQELVLSAGDLRPETQALVLRSVAGQGTALIDNTGGVVDGTGTMQRALDVAAVGGGYRHYSSPVQNETVATLAAPGFAPVFNPAAYNNTPTSGQANPFPTVFGYDQGRLTTAASSYTSFDKGWFSPAATDALLPRRGYTAQVPNGALVDFTGIFNNAAQNSGPLARTSGADAGWHLLGNPYPSPLNWSTVAPAQRPGLDAAVYVYQSSGPYIGTYRTYLPGTSTTSPLIDAGSGYFVRVSAATTPGAVNLTNANRVTTFGPQPAFGRGTAAATLALELASAQAADELLLAFDTTAPTGFDPTREAAKLTNPNGLNLAAVRGFDRLAVAAVALPTAAEVVVPLYLTAPVAGTYALRLPTATPPPAGLTLWLRDATLGTQQALLPGAGLALTLPVGTLPGRFALVLRPATVTATTAALTAATVGLYPNPAPGRFTVQLPPVAGAATATLSLFNALGQRLETRTLPLTAGGASTEFGRQERLPNGVYVLQITAGAASLARRVVVE